MPSANIDYSEASRALAVANDIPASPYVLSTPFGLSILEIQGQLVLPSSAPETESDTAVEGGNTFVKVENVDQKLVCAVRDAVQFGKLSFDEKDPSKVVLFIGTSQRLNGVVETLREPLAVLKVPSQDGDTDIRMVDIIYKKIIFKHRPLPIM